jgi:hypothetical protein
MLNKVYVGALFSSLTFTLHVQFEEENLESVASRVMLYWLRA